MSSDLGLAADVSPFISLRQSPNAPFDFGAASL
jgi:hypothetical protein